MARISNLVSGRQCHHIHFIILTRSLGPVRPICAQRWPKTLYISFHFAMSKNADVSDETHIWKHSPQLYAVGLSKDKKELKTLIISYVQNVYSTIFRYLNITLPPPHAWRWWSKARGGGGGSSSNNSINVPYLNTTPLVPRCVDM